MAKYPGFVGGSNEAFSSNADAQRTLNLYPEVISKDGKNSVVLRGTPGLSLWKTLATGPVRGLFSGGAPLTAGPDLYAVGGSKLYKIDSAGTVSASLGDVGNDNKPVQMFVNGTQLFIISAGHAYIHDGSSLTFAGLPNQVVGPGNLTDVASSTNSASAGAYLDGYFIVARPNSKQINISSLYNGLTWDALDFDFKVGYLDNISALFVDHQELWIFGESTTEIWRNTGNADFPLQRDPGAFIHHGCVARDTVARLGGAVTWLSGDSLGNPRLYRARGFQPERLSTPAVEAEWATYSPSIADAFGFAYEDQGHQFYQLTFPTYNTTWVYDLTTNLWHERSYWNGSAHQRHLASCYAFFHSDHVVGSRVDGKLYTMRHTAFTDEGATIKRIRTAPYLSNENLNTFHHRLTLDMETGAADPAPTVTLSYSDNGGHSWSTPKAPVYGTGALTDYTKRLIWRKLGKARTRSYSVEVASAGRVALVDAYLDATAGNA
jgi:hypothetical protein